MYASNKSVLSLIHCAISGQVLGPAAVQLTKSACLKKEWLCPIQFHACSLKVHGSQEHEEPKYNFGSCHGSILNQPNLFFLFFLFFSRFHPRNLLHVLIMVYPSLLITSENTKLKMDLLFEQTR